MAGRKVNHVFSPIVGEAALTVEEFSRVLCRVFSNRLAFCHRHPIGAENSIGPWMRRRRFADAPQLVGQTAMLAVEHEARCRGKPVALGIGQILVRNNVERSAERQLGPILLGLIQPFAQAAVRVSIPNNNHVHADAHFVPPTLRSKQLLHQRRLFCLIDACQRDGAIARDGQRPQHRRPSRCACQLVTGCAQTALTIEQSGAQTLEHFDIGLAQVQLQATRTRSRAAVSQRLPEHALFPASGRAIQDGLTVWRRHGPERQANPRAGRQRHTAAQGEHRVQHAAHTSGCGRAGAQGQRIMQAPTASDELHAVGFKASVLHAFTFAAASVGSHHVGIIGTSLAPPGQQQFTKPFALDPCGLHEHFRVSRMGCIGRGQSQHQGKVRDDVHASDRFALIDQFNAADLATARCQRCNFQHGENRALVPFEPRATLIERHFAMLRR